MSGSSKGKTESVGAKEMNLDKLILNIQTDMGRALMIKRLSEKKSVPKKYIQQAIDIFCENSEITDALELAENAGIENKSLFQKAFEFYKSYNNQEGTENAAGFAVKLKKYDLAIKLYSQIGQYRTAVGVAKEAGLKEKVRRLEVKALHQLIDKISHPSYPEIYVKFAERDAPKLDQIYSFAAEDAMKLEQYEIAMNMFMDAWNYANENKSHYFELGICAAKKGDLCNKLIDLFDNNFGRKTAIDLAKRLSMDKKVRELYNKEIEKCKSMGWFSDAAEIACEAGLKEAAINCYERGGYFEYAAEIAEELGLEKRARALYIKQISAWEKNGSKHAAEIAEKIGMTEKAIELRHRFIKRTEMLCGTEKAIEEAEKLNMKDLAQKLYQKEIKFREGIGQFDYASELAEKAGMNDVAQRLYSKAIKIHEGKGEFKSALKLAEKAGLTELVETYKMILADDDN